MFSATPDMMIQNFKGTVFPVEIKCPYKSYIDGFNLSPEYIKSSHWIQLQAQMLLMGASYGFLCIYMPARGTESEQAIIWKVFGSKESHKFILDLTYNVYAKLPQCKEEKDYKVQFRAKNGEKKSVKDFIDQEIKNNSRVVLRVNC